jgi:hypothetical protein
VTVIVTVPNKCDRDRDRDKDRDMDRDNDDVWRPVTSVKSYSSGAYMASALVCDGGYVCIAMPDMQTQCDNPAIYSGAVHLTGS